MINDCFIGEMPGQVVSGEQVAVHSIDWLMVKVGGHRKQVAYIGCSISDWRCLFLQKMTCLL